ncbi:hypothetical protein BT96DRAFT_550519 [Gymnopus androsaceus JB14]|uniref:Uncharacterized protein n=1 Tax=Gymnopus androsaceus JB14 TaxID=1447944 RepID=A0A6A4HWN7_9AGAR|nr:hypothetical protein BT96DRAFT_550519 [Gymnopus androsaceus JB14]
MPCISIHHREPTNFCLFLALQNTAASTSVSQFTHCPGAGTLAVTYRGVLQCWAGEMLDSLIPSHNPISSI